MKTIIIIAWRNVWRNKLRSMTVIISMILGLWAGFFTMALTLGLNEQRMDSAVKSYLSHVQIHNPKFQDTYNIKDSIADFKSINAILTGNKNIKAFSSRTIVIGMGATAHGALGLQVIGIEPENEKFVTNIHSCMKKGNYFSKTKSKPVLIGEALAEKLKLDLKKKLYITFVNEDGYQQKMKLKVNGIFKTASSLFDESNVYMKREDLLSYINKESVTHEIAIMCNSINDADSTKNELAKAFEEAKVETWADINPELGYANELMSTFIFIFMGIILLALSFGIINTMLMAVLERKRELGMLMSVGMNKTKVFLMIMFETLFISIVSTPIGIALSYMMIRYYGTHGLDLSVVGAGLESLGIGTRVYTYLPAELYFNICVMTLVVTFIASLWPARRALKLNPAEAVRAL